MNTELRSRPGPAASLLIPLALLTLLLAALVLTRLSAYGIWDPWELGIADAARKHAEGASGQATTLSVRLVAASFAAFGAREWAGRLPLALGGLLTLFVTGLWARLLGDRRTGFFSALVLVSTPFLLLHSREMMGATPAFASAALVMLGSSVAVFATDLSKAKLGFALLTALVGAGLGVLSAGVLSTVAPPLLSVAVVALLMGRASAPTGPQRQATWAVLAAALVVLGLVVRALLVRASGYSAWIGGTPMDGAIITYERVIEHLFHGFAPWSAVLPLALAAAMRTSGRSGNVQVLGPLCVVWAALAYAAQSIFLSSYGHLAFMAPGALAVAVALWLREREDAEDTDLTELVVALLMLGLIIRDFAFYPGSPFGALELGDTPVPAVFNPKRYWSALLGLFGAVLVLTSMASGTRDKLNLRLPYQRVRKLWTLSPGHKAWLIFLAALGVGLLAFGITAFAAPRALKLTSLGARIGRVLLFVPLAVPLAVAAAQGLYQLSVRLRGVRSSALIAAALLVGAYTSQFFLPQLSSHFSPRGVFDTYNKLAQPGEPLAQHRVEGRAAAYYADGEVRDINAQSELIDFLAGDKRKWAAFPSEQLADIDLAFRRRTGRHLFVPSLDNAKIMLAASQAVSGKPDKNPLTLYVKKQPPPMQFALNADFDGKIELLGYNLELPRADSVGPGQSFHVTWIWRAKQSNLGAYEIFLHVDEGDQRINGDHEPVDGKYPVRLWDQGDIIIDRQEVSIPATSPAGVYGLFVGLFRGDSRLKITSGPHDDSDRVRAGTVRVQ